MKVGKAIYNILSQSTDVQSNFPFNTTDYSPTGTELVTNGSFTDGVEKLTQPIDLVSDFVVNSGGSIIDADSFSTSGGGLDGIKSAYGLLTAGKSYKLVIAGSTTSSGFTIGDLSGNGNEYSPTGFGTFYFVALNLGGVWVRQQTLGTTDLTTFTIEELGGGWDFNAVDVTNTINIESGGARVISVGTNISLRQTILEVDKHYRLTCDTAITTGALGLDSYTAGTTTNFTEGANVVYFTAASTIFIIKRITGADNVLIDNITVQEMVLTKIFPELAPPDIDAPYIVYSVVSNSPSDTKNANGDIDTANVEVYGFQDTYNKAVDLGVSVRAALDRKTGTYNTIEIQSTNYVNEQMDVNEARKLWAAIQDYSIRIKNI